MQTDFIICARGENVTGSYPRTFAYFQLLGERLALKWAFISLEEVIELVDGSRYDAGAVDEIEGDPREVSVMVEAEIAAGSWAHLTDEE